MDYFKFLGSVLGVLMVCGGLGVSLYPGRVKHGMDRLYPEKRPRWLLGVGAGILAVTLWTWYQFLIDPAMGAFVVTLVMSLSMTKVVAAVLFYKKFREVTRTLMEETLAFRVVMMSSAAVGAALLSLAFLI